MNKRLLIPALLFGGFILISQVFDGLFGGSSSSTNDTAYTRQLSIEPTATAFTDWWDRSIAFAGEKAGFASNWVLIFDDSGSMAGGGCGTSGGQSKLEVARTSALDFVDQIPTHDKVGLILLNRSGLNFLAKRNEITNLIKQAEADGGTPIGDALRIAGEMLKEQGGKQLGYGQYNIVVLTDGEASDPEEMFDQVEGILEQTPIQLFAIGFCLGENHALNVAGQVRYFNADSPESLSVAFSDILAEAEKFDATGLEAFAVSQ